MTRKKADNGVRRLTREGVDRAERLVFNKEFEDILDAVKFDMVRSDLDYDEIIKKAHSISNYSFIGRKFTAVAEDLGFSAEELLNLLESEEYGVQIRRTRDHLLSIETRGPGGRRTKRSKEDLADPTASPKAEVNRMDKRIVAQVPKGLSYRFQEVARIRGESSLKEAFSKGFDLWRQAGGPELSTDHPDCTGEPIGFQVRVDADIPGVLSEIVAGSGVRKKDAIAQILIEYIECTT